MDIRDRRQLCVMARGLVEFGGFVGPEDDPIWVVWCERGGERVSVYAIPEVPGSSLNDDVHSVGVLTSLPEFSDEEFGAISEAVSAAVRRQRGSTH